MYYLKDATYMWASECNHRGAPGPSMLNSSSVRLKDLSKMPQSQWSKHHLDVLASVLKATSLITALRWETSLVALHSAGCRLSSRNCASDGGKQGPYISSGYSVWKGSNHFSPCRFLTPAIWTFFSTGQMETGKSVKTKKNKKFNPKKFSIFWCGTWAERLHFTVQKPWSVTSLNNVKIHVKEVLCSTD